MRNHDIHCRKLDPQQHRHDVTPALAFNHALVFGQAPFASLRRRFAAAGRDDQLQGVYQVVMAQMGRLTYFPSHHRMNWFGSFTCNALSWQGPHVSGNMQPEAVRNGHNKHNVAGCPVSARDGGQESLRGPSRRATECGDVALPLGVVEVEA